MWQNNIKIALAEVLTDFLSFFNNYVDMSHRKKKKIQIFLNFDVLTHTTLFVSQFLYFFFFLQSNSKELRLG